MVLICMEKLVEFFYFLEFLLPMLCYNAILECVEEKPKPRLSIEEMTTLKLKALQSHLQ